MDGDSYDARQPESVAAVLKVFAILQALSERNEIGISDLSVRLAMPKTTVYRFLQTMKTLGYVRREVDSERYGLSMKVFELGAKALQYPDMIEIAKPHMQPLSEATGETVHLGMLIDSETDSSGYPRYKATARAFDAAQWSLADMSPRAGWASMFEAAAAPR